MKKHILAAAIFAVASINSFGAACASGTLASLMGTSCTVGLTDQWLLSNFGMFGTPNSVNYGGAVQTDANLIATFANVGANGFSITYTDNVGVAPNFFNQAGPVGNQFGPTQGLEYRHGLWVSDNALSVGDSNIVSINNSMAGSFGNANITNTKVVQNQLGAGFGQIVVCTGCQNAITSLTQFADFGSSLSINDIAQWNAAGAAVDSANGFTSYTNTFLAAVPEGGIPEPMTFVLMGAGLVGIAALRRRKS